jgi:hypothetical protein
MKRLTYIYERERERMEINGRERDGIEREK